MATKTEKKRMGGIGKLSDYTPPGEQGEKDKRSDKADSDLATSHPQSAVTMEREASQAGVTQQGKPTEKKDPLVTVNIKILKSQQDWLADTAFQVRQNNEAPVPASDRVYPQHLIQTAIDLLKSSDVDWGQVKNIEDLRQVLKL